jgi:hypothetical protein
MKIPENLKNEHFVASFCEVSLSTVRRWRYENRGPRYRKVGALVRYSLDDLIAWLDLQPAGGSAMGAGQ